MSNRKVVVFFLLSVGSFGLTATFDFFFTEDDSASTIVEQVSRNLADEIAIVDKEAEGLLSAKGEAAWRSVSHSFFLMDSIAVLKWNQNNFLPDPRILLEDFEIKLLKFSRGSFILKKWKLKGQKSLLVVVPLQEQYSISNRYLVPDWNPLIFSAKDIEILEPLYATGYPVNWKGNALFKIQFSQSALEQYSDKNSIVLTLGWVAVLVFVAGLFFLVIDFHHQRKYAVAFFTLLLGIAILRAAMIACNFPRAFSSLFIFDPLQFASSSLNPSIADLLLNTIAVFFPGAYYFYTYYKWEGLRRTKKLNYIVRFGCVVAFLFAGYCSILFSLLFFETISHNSSISLDISQSISFDLIRALAFLSIILGSASTFFFCHAFLKMARFLSKDSWILFYGALLTASLIFLIFYKFSEKDYTVALVSGFTCFLVVHAAGLRSNLKRVSFATFLYIFAAILVLATQGAFSVKRLVEEETQEDQFKYGSNFLVDRDILGEYLLNETAKRISDDPFIQSRMATPFLAKSGVRQKINQVHLNSYFDRYDVQIYLYNASGETYDNIAKMDFASLINAFQKETNKTTYEGIYFVESAAQESAKRYLAIVPIKLHAPAGFIVLDLSLKKLIPQNVFPELLVDNQFINYFKNTDFSYAFFLTGALISASGNYNYDRDFNADLLGNPDLYRRGLEIGGYAHIGMEDSLGKVAVISTPQYSGFNLLANFCFLFVLGLCFVLFLLVVYSIILWRTGDRLNYAARIQVYVYLAFLLPLIAVSITTLSMISRSAESDLKDDFLKRSTIVGDRIRVSLDSYLRDESKLKPELESQLLNLTKLSNIDASVFSKDGKLIVSSQPLIYQNQLVSGLLDREAWTRIVEGKENSFIKNDVIGKLHFNTSYASLKSPSTGELIGILSIPFFDSADSLERTQISVWTNILVIFVAVFLLFSLVSFYLANWLTFPLHFIARTLGKTTFSGDNKPLAWKSDDEIGLLVSEYNRMLENLERSKTELERSQKESAWREIAKQIAHEINNPLTPMKLTLQRMEQAQINGTLGKESTEKSLQTLLAQVEILNQIASSFSTFARMPAPVLKKMDLYEVLKKVVDLHTNYTAATISLPSFKTIVIIGDEQLLIRVFSNLILNALQSVDEGRKVEITIALKIEDGFCLTSISDNGKGIDEKLKENVFLPHFSTKKSGSGIGLAIAKQGIELSGGTIWFESTLGLGTTFCVRLPLYS